MVDDAIWNRIFVKIQNSTLQDDRPGIRSDHLDPEEMAYLQEKGWIEEQVQVIFAWPLAEIDAPKADALKEPPTGSGSCRLSNIEQSILAKIAAEREIAGDNVNHYVLSHRAKDHGINLTPETCAEWFFDHLANYTTPYDGLTPSQKEIETKLQSFTDFVFSTPFGTGEGWHVPEIMHWMCLPKNVQDIVIRGLEKMGWTKEVWNEGREPAFFAPPRPH